MMGSGRGRFRRENFLRSEDKTNFGGRSALPSRYLWVGNLSHNVTENNLVNHFLRFGELQRVSFQPGRSFAFIDYKHEHEAFAAMKALQGFVLAGSPIRVEFTKDNKFSSPCLGEDKLQPHQAPRIKGSAFTQTDFRTAEELTPSEVLWIGYPPTITVDEPILSRAFSPFGEIHRITTFPGRSYAFVCFKSVAAACRAKEALEGKLLFSNSRVLIRFAKSESRPSDGERRSFTEDPPLSPPFESHGRMGLPYESLRQDRGSMKVPRYNDDWLEFPEDSFSVHGVKRLKTGLFSPEDDLPEFPLPAPVVPKEWRWEGTIAKGGKHVCQARCFPVGKAMDTMLPTIIDVTARTTTEMLAKHYYRAPSSWVVFFVPQNDDDIEHYNEFMRYLEEKQRVAVAKLNENKSLFLVPPSEFSEKVLKVPGKLSISGVVLRLEPQSANPGSAVIPEKPPGALTMPIPPLPSEQITKLASPVTGTNTPSCPGNWDGVDQGSSLQNSQTDTGVNYGLGSLITPERPQVSSSVPVLAPQHERLADLPSTFHRVQQGYVLPSPEVSSGSLHSHLVLQQQGLNEPQDLGSVAQVHSEDSDPGMRLQATLQLAAALLKNVQQGKEMK